MSTNFLLQQFLNEFLSGQIRAADIRFFIDRAIISSDNFHNFDPATGVVIYYHQETVLYSGNIGSHASKIAKDIGARNQSQVRVIDNTKISQFLDAIDNKNPLGGRLDKSNPVIKEACVRPEQLRQGGPGCGADGLGGAASRWPRGPRGDRLERGGAGQAWHRSFADAV